MKRFWRWLKALFGAGMDKLEDPGMMLDQARREMQEALVANREKAVQAITEKNRLESMVEEAENKSQLIENHVVAALKSGDRDLARELMIEKTQNDQTLESLQQTYEQALTTVENVKKALKHQENEVRKKAAEALAIKAQWKQAEIQNSISKALDGLTFDTQFESFGAITDKIKSKQAEAKARQELFTESVQGKTMDASLSAANVMAEEELKKLEERLGGAKKTTKKKAKSEVDEKLEKLEKRLNQE